MNIKRECPFCPPTIDQEDLILENEHCFFIHSMDPVLVGSGLIIPHQHRQTVFDLTEAGWAATFELIKRVKSLLDSKYSPQGYNIGWNCGQVAGQEVLHAHLHVIPRFDDEPLAGKGFRYWLKQETNKRSSTTPSGTAQGDLGV